MNHNPEIRKIIHKHWNVSSGSRITAMIQKYWGIGKFKNPAESVKIETIEEVRERMFS